MQGLAAGLLLVMELRTSTVATHGSKWPTPDGLAHLAQLGLVGHSATHRMRHAVMRPASGLRELLGRSASVHAACSS